RRPRVGCLDVHEGKRDIRHLLDAQAGIGEQAQDDDADHDHGRKNRVVDRYAGNPHRRSYILRTRRAGSALLRRAGTGRKATKPKTAFNAKPGAQVAPTAFAGDEARTSAGKPALRLSNGAARTGISGDK